MQPMFPTKKKNPTIISLQFTDSNPLSKVSSLTLVDEKNVFGRVDSTKGGHPDSPSSKSLDIVRNLRIGLHKFRRTLIFRKV